MLEVKVVRKKNKDYKNIEKLMLESFPKEELFSFRILNLFSKIRKCDYLCYYDNSSLIGISYSYKYNNLVFILYLAVSKEFHSKGYGSMILDYIKDKYKDSEFVLNVEKLDKNALNYKERERRYKFYYKNGFKKTGLVFKEEIVYDVLSTKENLEANEYQKLLKKMLFGTKLPKIEKE